MKILTENIDAFPYTGIRKVSGKVKIKDNKYTRKFFDGSSDAEQVYNVTIGKVYEAIRVEGFGDVEDVTIIDDKGNEQELADFFFEEVE